jgi:Ca2+-transporting ATPase
MTFFTRIQQGALGALVILRTALKKFFFIDGAQWAGAFAFNAFFSLFPLMILLVTIASVFVDRISAGKEIILYIGSFVPISGDMQSYIFSTISGVIEAREKAGAVALLALIWTSLQCFTTLICADNLAWGVPEKEWWRRPLKSLSLLGITTVLVLSAISVPVLVRMAKGLLFPARDLRSWVYSLGGFSIPLSVEFFGLSLFYKLTSPGSIRVSEVWVPAFCATLLLRLSETIFQIYLNNFSRLNAVYGAFGGIMALLLWIYFSGCIIIFGSCLCAVLKQGRSKKNQ